MNLLVGARWCPCIRNSEAQKSRVAPAFGSRPARTSAITYVSRRTITAGAGISLSTAAIVAGALAAGGVAMAATIGSSKDPRSYVSSGMVKFRQNKVEESLQDFDAAMAAAPQMRPYLWQRGLSLYYLGQYEEGAKQFRDDVAVNPNDTEESIWTFLCEAQLVGPDKARQQFLQVGRDSRPVMRAAYECFRTGDKPDKILQAVVDGPSGHDAFYARLYVGLWHEAHGDMEAAKAAILSANATQYAQLSGDYMASLSKVYALRRGWSA